MDGSRAELAREGDEVHGQSARWHKLFCLSECGDAMRVLPGAGTHHWEYVMSSSGAFPKDSAEVCALITTFHPDSGFPGRVEQVRPQVGAVIVVATDTGADPDEVAILNRWFAGMFGVTVSCLRENLGIAAALNAGIAIARQQGYRWVLTLDDDTTVMPGVVRTLIESWEAASRQGAKPIGIMGILYADANTGQRVGSPSRQSGLVVDKRGIITSGSLMSLDVHDAIGPFREEFFIDSVDYDYCLRARAKGFRVVRVCSVGMITSIGRATQHHIGCFTVQTTNHSAMRRYYMYRNSCVLAREYLLRDPLYAAAVVVHHVRTLLLILLFEEDRVPKLRCILEGLLDGWRNHLGKATWHGS